MSQDSLEPSEPVWVPQVLVGREYLPAFICMCDAAKESIEMLFYYWHLKPNIKEHPISQAIAAMSAAKARGVTVRILTAHGGTAAILRGLGFEVQKLHTSKTMHIKLVLFDKKAALVGSHNMTRNAMLENWEVSTVVLFPHAENRLTELFTNLWGV